MPAAPVTDATDDTGEAEETVAPGPVWLQDAIDRAGGPQRAVAALAILLVAIIALVWLIVWQVGGEGGGDEGEPTPTEVLQVIPIDDSGTPEDEPDATATPDAPPGVVDRGPESIPTQTPDESDSAPAERGSDNVLDQPSGSPAASSLDSTALCDSACLARVERNSVADTLLSEAGTRPSYSGEDWFWVVAQPDTIARISSELETTVIREDDSTLHLYMVELPSSNADASIVSQFGTVLDSAGTYRLVEVPFVPTNVRPVLDMGMTVEKVAPAPPQSMEQRAGDLQPLDQAGVGSLRAQVDPGRIEEMIADFQATSSTDGSGIGTRYYTTPGNQMAAENLYRRLESYGLDVWYEDFVTPEGLLLVNVIGEIEGRDPSRIYGVLAHFDTISELPTVSAPGADDNSSGMAASLEIARVLAGYDLQYTVRMVFVNAEEVGILGSDAFARRAAGSGEPWEGVFNIDSVGSARNGSHLVLNAVGESVWMEDLIARVNDGYGVGESLDILQTNEIVADDNRLRDHGLEAVLVARELYGWNPRHHTPTDVLESVSIPHTQSAAELVLLAVASLVQ